MAQHVPRHGMSPPLCPCCSSSFSDKNKGSSHPPALAPSALAARPLNLPRYLQDPQPQGQRAGGGPVSLAGRSRAGPPRGSGQRASHEPCRPPEQTHPLSGGEMLEPAAPRLRSQRCVHRPGVTRASARGRAGVGGRQRRTERNGTGPEGYVSPRAAQESGVAVAWRGEQSLPPCPPRCP